jgi:hypothetical protein
MLGIILKSGKELLMTVTKQTHTNVAFAYNTRITYTGNDAAFGIEAEQVRLLRITCAVHCLIIFLIDAANCDKMKNNEHFKM